MLHRLHLFHQTKLTIGFLSAFPLVLLLIWALPLLLFSSGESSLMAHDEGLYAWRSRLMIDTGDWIHPWTTPHHKTPGPYWLIASCYRLFGISEASARLPSMIAGVLSIQLVYEIGKILLGKKLAWLAAAILSVEFLWLQYCRLGTPDVPVIFLILFAIWSLLKAELHPKYGFVWCFLAGLSFGLGFLVRSFMIFLPIIALLPYLIWEHRRHRHLANPMLYFGFVVGLIPTFIWLWFSWLRYGDDSFGQLINFVLKLGSGERAHNGLGFYFWDIPLKAFPWFFFSLLGLVLLIRRPIPRYHLLLVGYPLILFAELSFFSTRLSHYSLLLYPFIALFAAVGLNWLSGGMRKQQRARGAGEAESSGHAARTGAGGARREMTFLSSSSSSSPVPPICFPRNLSYAFGVLGVLLLGVGMVALVWGDAQVDKYAIVALVSGTSWLILPLVWIGRYHLGKKSLTSRYWLASWLIPVWISLAAAGSSGFLGDYNPDVKAFIQQPTIAQVLHSSAVNFVDIRGKSDVLLKFYTPHHGKRVHQVSELPPLSYAWVSVKQMTNLSRRHRVLGTVQDVSLIELLNQF
ncbi:ArnT family glycosyltransferase [Brasilonema bromeliae]|uniref:Phospholipid carrier-dependent glycosyltransferase n=1 Tax=Brasilonema bromeliae SPC951 TaxID=385972 RepID=A0ABX1P4V5_9CYAN|nr:glycosyltransferase family 39 protein [Brasilonema bromeliae]NMG19118.1 phospholipid carrier-dependent glycosyltransferase [Brasilonema bromeliae SPC951]